MKSILLTVAERKRAAKTGYDGVRRRLTLGKGENGRKRAKTQENRVVCRAKKD
jgi:hypothetical protein